MGNHQTTVNLNANPDFTIAFATTETMVAADFVGVVSGKKVKDKVAKTGWKVENGRACERSCLHRPPVFTDFPMTMECRIERKIDESETGYYIVAKIVNIRVNEEYLAEDGKPDLEKMHLLTFDPVHLGLS
jgi:Flavin reductase like domain.